MSAGTERGVRTLWEHWGGRSPPDLAEALSLLLGVFRIPYSVTPPPHEQGRAAPSAPVLVTRGKRGGEPTPVAFESDKELVDTVDKLINCKLSQVYLDHYDTHALDCGERGGEYAFLLEWHHTPVDVEPAVRRQRPSVRQFIEEVKFAGLRYCTEKHGVPTDGRPKTLPAPAAAKSPRSSGVRRRRGW